MPSKRMVPAQEVSDLQEREVRLAAAKDAEIARLTAHGGESYEEGWRAASTRSEELLNKIAAKDAEIALLRNAIGWEASVAYRAEIADLEQTVLHLQDGEVQTTLREMFPKLDAAKAEIATLTEQRDRVVEAAREWADARRAAITECTPSTVDRLAKAEGDLAATVRALDAEAAAETAPSLPETP